MPRAEREHAQHGVVPAQHLDRALAPDPRMRVAERLGDQPAALLDALDQSADLVLVGQQCDLGVAAALGAGQRQDDVAGAVHSRGAVWRQRFQQVRVDLVLDTARRVQLEQGAQGFKQLVAGHPHGSLARPVQHPRLAPVLHEFRSSEAPALRNS